MTFSTRSRPFGSRNSLFPDERGKTRMPVIKSKVSFRIDESGDLVVSENGQAIVLRRNDLTADERNALLSFTCSGRFQTND